MLRYMSESRGFEHKPIIKLFNFVIHFFKQLFSCNFQSFYYKNKSSKQKR